MTKNTQTIASNILVVLSVLWAPLGPTPPLPLLPLLNDELLFIVVAKNWSGTDLTDPPPPPSPLPGEFWALGVVEPVWGNPSWDDGSFRVMVDGGEPFFLDSAGKMSTAE